MRLKLNPAECVGYGVCHQVLPEHIQLDEWGFPVMGTEADLETVVTGFERDRRDVEVPESDEHLAHRAVISCPALALRLSS